MTHIPSIHSEDRDHLFSLHKRFEHVALYTGCSVAAASFLIIGALIVIGCTSLLLTLPGVNVINHVILPGLLPGLAALIFAIPFIYNGVVLSRKKNALWNDLVNENLALITYYEVKRMDKDDRPKFILKNLFIRTWSKNFCAKLIGDMKKEYPKNQEKRIQKALDTALERVYTHSRK